MKLPVTQQIVADVLTEAHEATRLKAGSGWASAAWASARGQPFCGCAVGNLLWEASGREAEAHRIYDAAESCVMRDSDCVDRYSLECNVPRLLKTKNYLGAISCIFESRYNGSRESLDDTLASIRNSLPARFSIDIDGLRAMPTWKRKPANAALSKARGES